MLLYFLFSFGARKYVNHFTKVSKYGGIKATVQHEEN